MQTKRAVADSERPAAARLLEGWLLDAYAAPGEGVILWIVEAPAAAPPDADPQPDRCALPAPGACEDETHTRSRRWRLRLALPATFYASGASERLRALWQFLQAQDESPALRREQRHELFRREPTAVLAAEVADPAALPGLFARAAAAFPDLTFFDADLPVGLRLAAHYGAFPLARLRLQVDARGWVQTLQTSDSPWLLDPELPPLRVLRLAPDCDPRRSEPAFLLAQAGRREYRFSLAPGRALLINLRALLEQKDPDLLLTAWGDTWLLPRLMEMARQLALPLPLNRDADMPVVQRDERSYHAYGQVIYRGRQTLLAGRIHIDQYNAMMFHDYGLDGIFESARVTATPVQQAARLSPGSGISAMQMVTALRQGVLIPWHKQQAEDFKNARELVRADQGGLVYQPILGLHRDVAEIDFVSMYPGIMAYFNVSPETVRRAGAEPQSGGREAADRDPQPPEQPEALQRVPQLELWVDRSRPGLVPLTLRPLLEKRIALKLRATDLPKWDPRRAVYKARAAAHKWLLVTCFGYLGYKNARFGRIEAHQAVTAYSRECLLQAKEAAEEAGYETLHLYVDGMWVGGALPEHGSNRATGAASGFRTPAEVQPLLDEIARRTGLPIALEGIYRWVAFLPSKLDERIPAANRYFGVFQDGSLKVRGIEARRGDTPPYIAAVQMQLLQILARAPDADALPGLLPEAAAFLKREYRRLRCGSVSLPELVVTQKLSRTLEQYRSPSPAARAGQQLAALGKSLRPGQSVRFIYVRGGKPGVRAWDWPPEPLPEQVDLEYYALLFRRACHTVLQPLGVTPESLHRCLEGRGAYALVAPVWKLPGMGGDWV